MSNSALIDDFLSYIVDVRRLSPNTVRLRTVYLTRLGAEHELATATTVILRTWIADHARNSEWSAQTINVAVGTFRSFYRWAYEGGRISDNPAMPLRNVTIPQRTPRIATVDHIAAGLASARVEVRAFTLLGAECGLRVHEIAKLHTSERDGEWLTIVGKGGRRRSVRMSPELCAVLDELAAKHPGDSWYFPSPHRAHEHVATETLRGWARRELGTNPHSLRHRAGTTVYRGTENNLRVTQVFLGHRSPATTAIYVHVDRDDLTAASVASRFARA